MAAIIYAAFFVRTEAFVARRTTILVVLVLLFLWWSKYLPQILLAVGNPGNTFALLVPLGVSYFCFKLMHYAIDRGRNQFAPHTAGDFAGFMFLAPIFTAGPIERFENYLASRDLDFQPNYLIEGATRIIQGIVKKFFVCVLLAEAMEKVTGGSVLTLLSQLPSSSALQVWVFLYLSLAFIYFDFSAYTDIAIGASRVFGIRISENFNYPFLATSLPHFWLRWHMTLANWCRIYIYMSMIGLMRNPYVAILATFTVMGIWHAGWPPHWLVWGLWHGVGCIVALVWGRYAKRAKIAFFNSLPGTILAWAMTMTYVAMGAAFTSLHGRASLFDSVRLLAKGFGLDI